MIFKKVLREAIVRERCTVKLKTAWEFFQTGKTDKTKSPNKMKPDPKQPKIVVQ